MKYASKFAIFFTWFGIPRERKNFRSLTCKLAKISMFLSAGACANTYAPVGRGCACNFTLTGDAAHDIFPNSRQIKRAMKAAPADGVAKFNYIEGSLLPTRARDIKLCGEAQEERLKAAATELKTHYPLYSSLSLRRQSWGGWVLLLWLWLAGWAHAKYAACGREFVLHQKRASAAAAPEMRLRCKKGKKPTIISS
jgi:hypothetical protein